ncbi:sarcosine oxidase subunit gamma [Brachybacterium vulturis]|uniref:Sarcosine oxidase subunit gamma n=1 Tax=Brachybacterium vulturis TaxID=2017484 RepID=A0A291GMD6_9MICO|nr:sarcosine oxidase subunit gamma family protein [Brachybacterium vulturis]ATG51206.1 sarcosine oxidase subunit gamma [Brachybacterium vulturis]
MADRTLSPYTAAQADPVLSTGEATALLASRPADELRRSPVAHLAEAMAAAEVTGERSVALRELPFTVQIGLRAEIGSPSARALESELGLELPPHHGSTTGDADGLHVLWLAPDDFLAVDVSRAQRTGDEQRCAAALEGKPGLAVDLSGNRTVLELSGHSAREVLEKSCHADLHPREFTIGTAIVTALGTVPVILHRSAEETFRILPRASFADFLVRWLLDGMEEFGSEAIP